MSGDCGVLGSELQDFVSYDSILGLYGDNGKRKRKLLQ